MEFLNAVLLAGMAAVTIPVVIHLFHRSRFRIVNWGAMHLLESVLRKNTRRLKLEQLILLLLRCAIPVFLAICMARPVITGLEPLLGNAKSSTVLVLDNSYSMEAGGPGRTNFQEAREAARQIVDQQVQGSDVALVSMAGGASAGAEPTFDLDRARGELSRSRSGFGTALAYDSLRAAQATASKMHHAHREIVVLSDFQKVSWGEEGGLPGATRARLADELARGPVKPTVTFFRVGREITDNVSMEQPTFSRMILGVGQKLVVHANLKNHGDQSYPDLRVVLKVDGRERSVAQTSLDPHAHAQVLFTHAFDTAGSHVVELMADADPLTADNGWLASIPVWDRVPVLLVSGDPNPEPLRGETDFIEIALRPFGAAKVELADLITTSTIEARDLDQKRLAEARVVLLANVPQLNEAQLKALDAFVREGGGLLIFPGNRINSAWYNTTLAADGRGLLPLPVVSLAGSMNQAGTQSSIVAQHFEHPALEMFNDPRNGNLSDAQIWLWYKMRAELGRNADPTLTVLARLDTGDPLLVEKQFGEGRVIQAAIPCDADWSNLPMRPFYLPLMQQLVTYLASKVHPSRNVDVGRPLVAFLPLADAGKKALFTDPDGRATEVVVANRGTRGMVEFTQTDRPGLYVLDAPGGNRIHFVANTDRKESDLRQLDPGELQAVAKAMGATVVTSWAEYRQMDQKRRYGQEVWQMLLVGVLGFIFLEMLLEQFFARRRT
jgi:hypothetical protein